MTPEKTCFKCSRCLPLDEFYAHPMMGDKHLGKCKVCTRKDVQEHRAANRERWRRWDNARYRSGKVPPKAPDHIRKARVALHNAVARGKVTKPNKCQDCGEEFPSRRIQGHHYDYTKPMEVDWLCSICHGKRHRMDAERRQA